MNPACPASESAATARLCLRGAFPLLLRPVKAEESEDFDHFVGQHVHGDPLQGWGFADLQAGKGRMPHRFYLMEQGRPIGSLSLIAADMGRLGLLLYAPRGPVLDPGQRILWRHLTLELRARFPQAFAFFCAPRLDDRLPRPPGYLQRGTQPLLPRVPRATVEVPLSGDPALDFGRVQRRCRVRVRRAPARGVKVRAAGTEEIGTLLGLWHGAGEAPSLAATPAALADMVGAFLERGQARVFLAESQGSVRAATVALSLGRHALCQHLGQDGAGQYRQAAYAAQWAAIAWAEGQGAERCDITGFRTRDDANLGDLARRWGGVERRYALLEVPLRLGPYIGYRLLPTGASGRGPAPATAEAR